MIFTGPFTCVHVCTHVNGHCHCTCLCGKMHEVCSTMHVSGLHNNTMNIIMNINLVTGSFTNLNFKKNNFNAPAKRDGDGDLLGIGNRHSNMQDTD